MIRAALAALGMIVASVAIFLFAAWLFPGNPGRFYLIVALITTSAALLWKLLVQSSPEKSE